MNDTQYQWKVGLFVATGLALMALLVLNFTKGVTLFNSSYNLRIDMPTTAGLKPTADVMISGVPVGKVTGFRLKSDNRSVRITVQILSQYKISRDSVFGIDALGFLGDQYIEVTPPPTNSPGAGDFLKDGDLVQGQPPFDMQEAVRFTSGLLDEARKTIRDLDQAVTNINRTVLSDQNLASLSLSISNLEHITTIAVTAAHSAADLIHTNVAPINEAIANVKMFSGRLDAMADNLEGLIATNRPEVDQAVQNLRDASANFKQIASDLQAGKGPVGELLKDETMKAQIVSAVSNANQLTAELSAFGSNLNQRGIWSMLWKPKHPTEKSGH